MRSKYFSSTYFQTRWLSVMKFLYTTVLLLSSSSYILTELFGGQKYLLNKNKLEYFMACESGMSCFLFHSPYQGAIQNPGCVCTAEEAHCDSAGTRTMTLFLFWVSQNSKPIVLKVELALFSSICPYWALFVTFLPSHIAFRIFFFCNLCSLICYYFDTKSLGLFAGVRVSLF